MLANIVTAVSCASTVVSILYLVSVLKLRGNMLSWKEKKELEMSFFYVYQENMAISVHYSIRFINFGERVVNARIPGEMLVKYKPNV